MTGNFQSFQVNEKSARLFTPTYLDENGLPVTPTGVTWTLSDQNGNIINSRQNVALTPPAAIVLLALDTALQSPTDLGLRILTIKVLYTSATMGANTPINQEFGFTVNPLVNVT